jgi:AbrB family looped-hinge helix DNA binding protein
MKEVTTTVTTKGQVTIPADIRQRMGIRPHDRIRFRISGGEVRLSRVPLTLDDVYGAVQPLSRPEDFNAMQKIVEEERAQENASKLRRRA